MTALVSIPMVTFRHEAFVGQAIESVIAQDFEDWEIVVGDDASPDGTMDVVRAYAGRFPDRIRILPHTEHIGPRNNFIRTLQDCRGRYVAQLDGDDAWCWYGKLRAQVAFLEANPDFAWVFCASRKVFADPHRDHDWFPPGRRSRYELADLIQVCFTGSGAAMFRRQHLELPPWFATAPVGDWPLHALNARHGPIGYIDRVGMTYRQHAAGRWAGLDELRQLRVQMATREQVFEHLGAGLEAPYWRARLADRVREITLVCEAEAPELTPEALVALMETPEWARYADAGLRLKGARALERLGLPGDARRVLGKLLGRAGADLPRGKVLQRWARCTLKSLLASGRPG